MGTVRKIKKAQDGALCNWSSKRGGGVSCGRGGGPKSSEWKPGRIPRMTRKEREDSEKTYRVEERLKASGPKKLEHSTAPGVRDMKKGSQDFFGRDKREDEARYGKKIKKAQRGAGVPKGKVESEMFPGKYIPISKSNYENKSYGKMLSSGKSAAPKKKMKSGGSLIKPKGCMACGGKMKKK